MIRAYLAALAAADADAVNALFDDHALVEIPFLKPNRLVGKTEIGAGHRAIFATLDSFEFHLATVDSNATHAIAEGRLRFSRDGGCGQELAAGLVAELGENGLQRLSLYSDARNIRPWSDEAIL